MVDKKDKTAEADPTVLPPAVDGVPPVISETATSDPTGTNPSIAGGGNVPDGAMSTAAPGDAPAPMPVNASSPDAAVADVPRTADVGDEPVKSGKRKDDR